jgi:hypothetical protein
MNYIIHFSVEPMGTDHKANISANSEQEAVNKLLQGSAFPELINISSCKAGTGSSGRSDQYLQRKGFSS